MSFAEYAFVDRNGIDAHLAQTVYGRALYGMPVVEGHRTVSVDSTFAGYCDICALVCVCRLMLLFSVMAPLMK